MSLPGALSPRNRTLRSSSAWSSWAVSPGTLVACRDSSPSCTGGAGRRGGGEAGKWGGTHPRLSHTHGPSPAGLQQAQIAPTLAQGLHACLLRGGARLAARRLQLLPALVQLLACLIVLGLEVIVMGLQARARHECGEAKARRQITAVVPSKRASLQRASARSRHVPEPAALPVIP